MLGQARPVLAMERGEAGEEGGTERGAAGGKGDMERGENGEKGDMEVDTGEGDFYTGVIEGFYNRPWTR